MNRQEFEHIVRTAVGITGGKEVIIIGSQSILGNFHDAPRSLRHSMDLDLYLNDRPELAELITTLQPHSSFRQRKFVFSISLAGIRWSTLSTQDGARGYPSMSLYREGEFF